MINGGAVYLIYVLAVGARCARKVRNAKLFAAHFLKATRRGRNHPPRVAAVLLTLIWKMGGNRKGILTFARAARPEGKGLIRKKGKTVRLSPSCAQCGRAGREYTVMDKQFRKTI